MAVLSWGQIRLHETSPAWFLQRGLDLEEQQWGATVYSCIHLTDELFTQVETQSWAERKENYNHSKGRLDWEAELIAPLNQGMAGYTTCLHAGRPTIPHLPCFHCSEWQWHDTLPSWMRKSTSPFFSARKCTPINLSLWSARNGTKTSTRPCWRCLEQSAMTAPRCILNHWIQEGDALC